MRRNERQGKDMKKIKINIGILAGEIKDERTEEKVVGQGKDNNRELDNIGDSGRADGGSDTDDNKRDQGLDNGAEGSGRADGRK